VSACHDFAPANRFHVLARFQLKSLASLQNDVALSAIKRFSSDLSSRKIGNKSGNQSMNTSSWLRLTRILVGHLAQLIRQEVTRKG